MATKIIGPFNLIGSIGGTLCDSTVTWAEDFVPLDGYSASLPALTYHGGSVLVSDPIPNNSTTPSTVSPGVLTLTPTVHTADGDVPLSPLVLTFELEELPPSIAKVICGGSGPSTYETRVFSIPDGAELAIINNSNSSNYSCKISPNGAYLALGGASIVYLHDTANWNQIRSYASAAAVYGIDFSPDSSKIAVTTYNNSPPRSYIYDVSSGELLETLIVPGNCTSIVFSPDGTKLAVGQGGTYSTPKLTVFNTNDYSEITGTPTYTGTSTACRALAWSIDSAKLFIGTPVGFYVDIYNTSNWSKITYISLSYQCYGLAVSLNGLYLAVAQYGGVGLRLFNTSNWSEITIPYLVGKSYQGTGVAFSSDGVYVACSFTQNPFFLVFRISDLALVFDNSVVFAQGLCIEMT